MATISITYPDEYADDVIAALRESLADDADGLTDEQAVNKAVKRMVKNLVRAYRQRNAPLVSTAVVVAERALADKEDAAALAFQARQIAAETEGAAVETAFGRDS